MFKKILVGLDGSDGSWKAFGRALELCGASPGCDLWVVSVEEGLPRMPEVIDELVEEKARQNAIFGALHGQALNRAREAGVELNVQTLAGHTAQAITAMAERGGFDLVVIGHSGHSGVWGTFLGGTADKIVRHATCSVLVVR